VVAVAVLHYLLVLLVATAVAVKVATQSPPQQAQ
jgi:hypothetical protein